MTRFEITFEAKLDDIVAKDKLYQGLLNLHYSVRDVRFERLPEPSSLKDFNPACIRPSLGKELYRIVIPGLTKDGEEVTVPVDEDPYYDSEALAQILRYNGFEASDAPL